MQKTRGLRLMRLLRGETQLKVSMRTKIPQTVLSFYETGYKKPTGRHLAALLKYYHLTPEGLAKLEQVLE